MSRTNELHQEAVAAVGAKIAAGEIDQAQAVAELGKLGFDRSDALDHFNAALFDAAPRRYLRISPDQWRRKVEAMERGAA